MITDKHESPKCGVASTNVQKWKIKNRVNQRAIRTPVLAQMCKQKNVCFLFDMSVRKNLICYFAWLAKDGTSITAGCANNISPIMGQLAFQNLKCDVRGSLGSRNHHFV